MTYLEELREELERYKTQAEQCREQIELARESKDYPRLEYWKGELRDTLYTIEDIEEDIRTAEENEDEYEALGITDYDSPISAGYKLAGMSMRDFL